MAHKHGVDGFRAPSLRHRRRDYFRDESLRKIIELALGNNRDLRVASLNVEQIRAQYRIQRAALLPSIDAFGNGGRSRTPRAFSPTGQPIIAGTYIASAGATAYELDLFGRVDSLKNKSMETYLESEESRRSVQLSLVAEVSLQYFTGYA